MLVKEVVMLLLCKTYLAIFLSLSLSSCAVADSAKTGEALPQPYKNISNDPPAPPAVFLDTKMAKRTGRKIRVSGDLQKAIDEASAGDVLILRAGKVFLGNFTLPRKQGKGWITIRSSAITQLPIEGKRVSPEDAQFMPRIISPNSHPAIATTPGAHHFRLIGIEVGVAENVAVNYSLISLGEDSKRQTSLDHVPQDLIIDRCYIHGNTDSTLRRGITLNSARAAVIDSYISDCHEAGADSQAICGWNGPGPFKIVNNYLEGAGENVMFGGGEPGIEGLVPSDIEFRGNHCFKPLAWKADDPQFAGRRWTVKNLFELKNARRVLVDGNLFENNWADAQTGYAILFTVRSQGPKAPWTVVEDVLFTNNVVRHTSAAVNILGRDSNNPSQQATRISITNNLFEDVSSDKRKGDGAFLKITDAANVTIDHNTVIQSGNIITAYSAPNPKFVFINNIVRHNRYGVKGDGAGTGAATIEKYFPDAIFRKNAFVGAQSNLYPDDNFFPAEISFAGQEGQNLKLPSNSAFVNAGTDGKSLGCDIDALKPAFGSVGKTE